MSRDKAREAAAARALFFVEDGMVLGFGTGSTAEAFLTLLAARAQLHVRGVATSKRTEAFAENLGLSLIAPEDAPPFLDLVVDGADEVAPNLDLIKGLGGALLREKIAARAAKRMIVIADEGKKVRHLGARVPVPVELFAYGARATCAQIESLAQGTGTGAQARRLDGVPVLSDNGNPIYDCAFGPIHKPAELAHALDALPGVAAHGLFINLASAVIIGNGRGETDMMTNTTKGGVV